MTFSLRRFIVFLLLLFLAVALGARMREWAGWSIEFAFAALVTFALWSPLAEEILLVLAGVLVVNWKPAISFEMAVFALVPIAAWCARRAAPWIVPLRGGVMNAIVIAFGVLLLYAASYGGIAIAKEPFLWKDIAGSACAGVLLHLVLKWLYERRAPGRGVLYTAPQ